MSGSGGGDLGGPIDSGRDCDALTFVTTLSSPAPDVIGQLSEDDQCAIQLRDEQGVRVLAVVADDGRIAGTLTSHVPELIRCIQQGYEYVAEVLSISGGAVRVRVSSTS